MFNSFVVLEGSLFCIKLLANVGNCKFVTLFKTWRDDFDWNSTTQNSRKCWVVAWVTFVISIICYSCTDHCTKLLNFCTNKLNTWTIVWSKSNQKVICSSSVALITEIFLIHLSLRILNCYNHMRWLSHDGRWFNCCFSKKKVSCDFSIIFWFIFIGE